MKLFIWQSVSDLTDNWHSGGGLVVIASSLIRAREMMHEQEIPKDCEAYKVDPDTTLDIVQDTEEKVFIMPDSGCC